MERRHLACNQTRIPRAHTSIGPAGPDPELTRQCNACRHVCAPYHSTGSDQASKTLFCGYAEEWALWPLRFYSRLRHRRIHRLLGHIQIAFAAPVPARIISLSVYFATAAYSVMKMHFSADYRRECQVTEVCYLPVFGPIRHDVQSADVNLPRIQLSIQRRLSFRPRLPAPMHPQPLVGIFPHVVLNHFGKHLRVRRDVGLQVTGPNQFERGIES